jgi:hypothetical protein
MTYLQNPPATEFALARRQTTLPGRSRRVLLQLSTVLVLAVLAAAAMAIWKRDLIADVYLADAKSLILNGVIILLFGLGCGRLLQGLLHYAREEREIERFLRLRAEGVECAAVFEQEENSLMARRIRAVTDLFARGVPIDHGAIAAIEVAQESLFQSFPRFVNNVLILTGVFGTVTSLIIALVGASNVLQTTLPGEGMGVMLLGMNTALTTTATAIVCYFFFTFFYQKLTDVQTYVLSEVERAVMLHVVPEYAFDTESVNHETRRLVNEVRALVGDLRTGVLGVDQTLARLGEQEDMQLQKLNAVLAAQEEQSRQVENIVSHLDQVRRVLIEGFRLE